MWIEVIKKFLYLSVELSLLFIGISFLINVVQQLIPYEKVEAFMFNKNPVVGAIVAVLFAFITPFCSCSTIPLVVGMLQKKVRFGIVMIFLFTSPILDPTIVSLMAVMLGWKVALIYTIATSIFGAAIGFLLEKFGFERYVKNVIISGYEKQLNTSGKISVRLAVSETLTLMKTVYPYLIIGAAIGSIIQGAVPTEWISTYFGSGKWWLIPVAAIVGIPLYIRLSTMIPISQIMVAKGMALGPIMALVISSAGASLPELTLLNSIFKKELVMAFVASVFTMATLSGTIFYLI